MPIKSGGAILVDESGKAVSVLSSCVTPIFDLNDNGKVQLLGSGVLIQIGSDVFLCTAQHVIDANKHSTLYIDGRSKLETLRGNFYVSLDHDAAVLKLSSEQSYLLKKYTPLPSECIASQHETSSSKYASIVGFPETKNRKVYQQNKFKGHVYSVGGMIIDTALCRVRVSFNRNKNIDAKTRRRVKAPNPHGMSGGAIFGLPLDSNTIKGSPKPKLIGLITDCPDQSKEMFGPSITIALAMLRDGYAVVLPQRLQAPNIKIRVTFSKSLLI